MFASGVILRCTGYQVRYLASTRYYLPPPKSSSTRRRFCRRDLLDTPWSHVSVFPCPPFVGGLVKGKTSKLNDDYSMDHLK